MVLAPTLALATWFQAVPAQAAGVDVSLSTTDSTPALGTPFTFTTKLTNPTRNTKTFYIRYTLVENATSASVAFYRWLGTLAPGQSIHFKRSVTTSTDFAGTGSFSVQLSSLAFTGTPSIDLKVTAAKVSVPRFKEVAASAGVRDSNQIAADCAGTTGIGDNYISGSAWGDVNGDGWPDLYVPEQTGLSHLYINQKDGTFIDQATAFGVTNGGSVGIGATIVDYNNDGDEDIYVVNNGPNRLYRNNGSGTFTDVTAQAGVGQAGPGSSSSWGDFNNDGNVDLAVTNWGTCGQNGAPITYGGIFLYMNNGDGTFSDVTSLLARTGDVTGASFIPTWFDYNHDGLIDLYLGNDYLGPSPRPNLLWRNDGPAGGTWSFTNVSAGTGTELSINNMGTAVGDYNRDGTLDLALSNISKTQLLKNAPMGTFSSVTGGAGVTGSQVTSQKSVTWGVQFSDFNLDSWPDLYFPNGSLRRDSSNPEPLANQLFANNHGKFLDLSAPSMTNDPAISRGMSLTDFNRDGKPDMFVANQDGYPDLYQNTTATHGHWLELTLEGTKSNRDACGAWVTAKISKTVKLVREVFCGSVGVGSGNWKVLHFGLGKATNIASLTIEWPSGSTQVIKNLSVDRFKTVVEP